MADPVPAVIRIEDLWDARYRNPGGTYVIEGVTQTPPDPGGVDPPPGNGDGGTTVADGFAPAAEVNKGSGFTLAKDDNGKRFVLTDQITVTMPAIGVCGNGFEVEVLNNSGGDVTIDGPGSTNVTLADSDMARIVEANGRQLVWSNTTTSIADVFETTVDWTPAVFGIDLDLNHWWDARRGVTLDSVTGKVTSWDDTIALDATTSPSHLGHEGYIGKQTVVTQQPTWVDTDADGLQDEIRFDGAKLGLVIGTQSRNGWENRWFAALLRVNWAAMTSDSFFFSFNGFAVKNGNEVPKLNWIRSTHEVQAVWGANDGEKSVKTTLPGADNTWHSIVARRNEDAIYISVDGKAEVSTSTYSRSMLDSGSSPTGWIGNGYSSGTSISWGLDTLLEGQGPLSTDEVAALHGWMMHRRGQQANLDVSNPYVTDAPEMVASDFHVPRHDSFADGYRFPVTGGWDDSVRGQAVSLTGFTRTFHDHFTSLSTITDGLTGAGQWWAPAHIDTSGAHFRRPGQAPTDTFTILPDNTTLQIKMSQINNTGAWYSGHIQSVDCWANGFTQTCPAGGALYYEARMAFNYLGGNATKGFVSNAPGWCAFWLYSQQQFKNSDRTLCELDVVEAYGATGTTTTQQHHATTFTHPAYRPQPGNIQNGTTSRSPSKVTNMTSAPFNSPTALFDGQGAGAPGNFHIYSVRIDETWITWYFDGIAISRFPTFKEALGPLYHIVSFQTQGLSTGDVESYMWIDYVSAWIHA